MTLKFIQETLHHELPGEKAHAKMAPIPLTVEGLSHSKPPINSAVLLLLVPHQGDLAILFIQRTNAGKHHAGQIALPGGKVEPEDMNSRSTALRECYEEIGVPPDEIAIMGRLSDTYIPLSNFNITPFVGTIPKMPNFVLSKNEVDNVIIIPLNELFDDKNKTTRSLYRRDQPIVAPGYKIGEHFIWGATAMMIAELESLIKNEE